MAEDVDQELHDALDRYQRSGLRALGLGLAAVASSAVAAQVGLLDWPHALIPAMVGMFGVGLGLSTLLRAFRISRSLRQGAWSERTCQFEVGIVRGHATPVLRLSPTAAEPEAVVQPSTSPLKWPALRRATEVWVVGDPQSRIAAAIPPGSGTVVVVKRPYFDIKRRELRRIVMHERQTWPWRS